MTAGTTDGPSVPGALAGTDVPGLGGSEGCIRDPEAGWAARGTADEGSTLVGSINTSCEELGASVTGGAWAAAALARA